MTIALIALGFALLAAGTYRQAHRLFRRAPHGRTRLLLLIAGHAALLSSLVVRLNQPDAARGLVAWFGELTAAALLVVLGCWLLAGRQPER